MYDYNLAIRFQRIAAKHGTRTAIWFSADQIISYDELNRLSNRAARLLRARGVTSGSVVCISGTKTTATFAFIIASSMGFVGRVTVSLRRSIILIPFPNGSGKFSQEKILCQNND